MELRQIRYFVTVAREGGFARAADRLHIVQPAVSQQIARLERELGVRLFDRSGRRARLTAAGARLLPEAEAMLATEQRVHRIAADLTAGSAALLRLGTSQGMGHRLDRLLDALPPDIQIRLTSLPLDQRLAAVRTGQLDAAFVRALTTAPGLELLPAWTEPLAVALPASHPLAARPVLTVAELAGLPLRLAPRPDNPPLYDLILDACRAAGFEPVVAAPFTTVQDTLAEIGAGPASWTVLYESMSDTPRPARVALRPLAEHTVATSLAVPPQVPTPPLRHLIAALTEVGTAPSTPSAP